MTTPRSPQPRLHPDAIRLVARLIKEGRAGERPFGVPLPRWEQEIERLTAPAEVSRE